MKICHVISCFPPSYGGFERSAYTLCRELVKKGHDVLVITTDRGIKAGPKHHEQMEDIKVIRYPESLHFLDSPFVPQLGLRSILEDWDILHVHGVTPSISDLAIVLGKLKTKPVILTYHCDAIAQFGFVGRVVNCVYNNVSLLVTSIADCIVATTRSYALASPVLSRLLNKVRIIPWAVENNKFKPLSLSSLQGSSDNHRILFVGQLKEYKGLRGLLNAMKLIKRKVKDSHLVIVGDGPLRQYLMNYASQQRMNDMITFMGNVGDNELLKFYATSDVVVLPSCSGREAFGLVLLEAMAAGKPVVATNIPGVRDVVREDCGILVPPKDISALAVAIVELLLNEDKACKMGSCAREFVSRNFIWKDIVQKYETLYKTLCKYKKFS